MQPPAPPSPAYFDENGELRATPNQVGLQRASLAVDRRPTVRALRVRRDRDGNPVLDADGNPVKEKAATTSPDLALAQSWTVSVACYEVAPATGERKLFYRTPFTWKHQGWNPDLGLTKGPKSAFQQFPMGPERHTCWTPWSATNLDYRVDEGDLAFAKYTLERHGPGTLPWPMEAGNQPGDDPVHSLGRRLGFAPTEGPAPPPPKEGPAPPLPPKGPIDDLEPGDDTETLGYQTAFPETAADGREPSYVFAVEADRIQPAGRATLMETKPVALSTLWLAPMAAGLTQLSEEQGARLDTATAARQLQDRVISNIAKNSYGRRVPGSTEPAPFDTYELKFQVEHAASVDLQAGLFTKEPGTYYEPSELTVQVAIVDDVMVTGIFQVSAKITKTNSSFSV